MTYNNIEVGHVKNMIEWNKNFMKNIMSSMGFPLRWINLIIKCVTSESFLGLINGQPHSEFRPHKELKRRSFISLSIHFVSRNLFRYD